LTTQDASSSKKKKKKKKKKNDFLCNICSDKLPEHPKSSFPKGDRVLQLQFTASRWRDHHFNWTLPQVPTITYYTSDVKNNPPAHLHLSCQRLAHYLVPTNPKDKDHPTAST
jgi:hypothetical protein